MYPLKSLTSSEIKTIEFLHEMPICRHCGSVNDSVEERTISTKDYDIDSEIICEDCHCDWQNELDKECAEIESNRYR